MRPFLVAALLGAVSIGAAQAETVYVGNSFIDFVSGDSRCTSTFAVHDTARVLFRPRGTAFGNGANAHLAYMTTRSSFVMRVSGNDFQASVNYVGSGVGSRANLLSNSGGITVWEQSPAVIGPGTPTVAIKGRFANFFAISGCFVEISANLVAR